MIEESTTTTYFPTALGVDIWSHKYAGEYTDPQRYYEDLAKRVSLGSSAAEERFYTLLTDFRFSPGGRILAWNGRPDAKVSLQNCTTHSVESDDLDAIAETMRVVMRASSHGQGIGINLGNLRPLGAPVNNAAKSSTGAISFMELLNHVSGTIGQQGRRAAVLYAMPDNHPDLWRDTIDIVCDTCGGKGCFRCRGKGGYSYDFLNIKRIPGKVEGANISVMITDAFMEAVQKDQDWKLAFDGASGKGPFHVERTVRARDLFHALAHGAWSAAEPGVLFWDTSQRMSNSDVFGFNIVSPNACVHGKTLVTTEAGDISIEALAEMAVPPRVLTFNEHTGALEYDESLWIKKTREDATVITLELEDGREITLTPDHRVLTENRGWVSAGQLTLDDIVVTAIG